MCSLHAQNPERYLISEMCRLFGVTKQAYYKERKSIFALSAGQEAEIVEFARAERELDPRIGCRKLWYIFLEFNEYISRSKFEDVMAAYGLKIKQKRTSTRTTNSLHGLPTYPNLVFSTIPQRPCQIWVADITYIRLYNCDGTTRFCYLSLVTDAYSRYILGYYVGIKLETVYSIFALTMALENSRKLQLPLQGLIHHSDRGVQYASTDYVNILNQNNIRISMTENGNPKDNPQAERINSTIKNELLAGLTFTQISDIANILPQRIDYYNNRRPHMSLDRMTPAQALMHTGELRKDWNSLRDEAIKRIQT